MLQMCYGGGGDSYFDGTFFEYLGYRIGGTLICLVSVGLAFPWVCCMFQRWETRHTVIEGRRMYFDGTGAQLVGNWLKWMLLAIITFGIYAWFIPIKVRKWVTKHTFFVRG